MKKILTIVLALVIATALMGPAGAAKGKKKKAPKPYTSEEVTIIASHPAFHGQSGTLLTVTAQEFIQTCSIPQSNGADAYVFEVPEAYKTITSSIKVTGSGSPVEHDLDIYLFDDACAEVGVFNTTSADETGVVSPGAAFILIHAYAGAEIATQFTLTPYA